MLGRYVCCLQVFSDGERARAVIVVEIEGGGVRFEVLGLECWDVGTAGVN